MILGTLFWLIGTTAVLGAVIFLVELFKDEKSRSGFVVGIAIISVIIAGVALLLVSGFSSEADFSYGLDDNQVYYLDSATPDPANTLMTNLIVFKADTITGEKKNPIITVRLSKEKIAQGVEPGKYIIKNAQGQVETWTAPIKT